MSRKSGALYNIKRFDTVASSVVTWQPDYSSYPKLKCFHTALPCLQRARITIIERKLQQGLPNFPTCLQLSYFLKHLILDNIHPTTDTVLGIITTHQRPETFSYKHLITTSTPLSTITDSLKVMLLYIFPGWRPKLGLLKAFGHMEKITVEDLKAFKVLVRLQTPSMNVPGWLMSDMDYFENCMNVNLHFHAAKGEHIKMAKRL